MCMTLGIHTLFVQSIKACFKVVVIRSIWYVVAEVRVELMLRLGN